MTSVNRNTINKTLHITADIYNIIMKNKVINKCDNKQFEYNTTYYRNIYKNKDFDKIIKKNQLFCGNFCGDITNCSCFVRYDNRG